MTSRPPIFFRTDRLVLLLLLGCFVAGCGNPAGPATASPKKTAASPVTNTAKNMTIVSTNEFVMHTAVFENWPGRKDPFFPNSGRLPKKSDGTSTVKQPPRLPLSSYIKLSAIRPSKIRPIAMINQTFFEPGELGDVTIRFPNSAGTTDSQKVRIRCLEIRQDSVLISIEGEPGVKELRQPTGP